MDWIEPNSGIIEAVSFWMRVVNVENRQSLHQLNSNIIDVEIDVDVINKVLKTAIKSGERQITCLYGDGSAGKKSIRDT
jgi:hypothetical protein